MGGTGAGKSTVAQLLSQRIGFPVCEVGHVVKQMYRSSLEKDLLQLYADDTMVQRQIEILLKNHGKEYFTNQRLRYTREMVRQSGNDYFVRHLLLHHRKENLIIVGVRTNQEVCAIRALRKHPYFVALQCNADMLVNRFIERERRYMEQHVAKNIFDKRYESERDRGLTDVMIECDLLLNTDYISPEQLADYILLGYSRFQIRQEPVIGGT